MLAAYTYPLLDLFWTILWIALWVFWIWLLIEPGRVCWRLNLF